MMLLPCSDRMGATRCAKSSKSSLVCALSRLYISVVARSSSSPEVSRASIVFSKVGASGLSTMAATALFSASMPAWMASSIWATVMSGKGYTP